MMSMGFLIGIIFDDLELSSLMVPIVGIPLLLSAGFVKTVGSMPT